MNYTPRVLVQNTAGRLVHYFAANEYSLIGRELFIAGNDTVLELPDRGIVIRGSESIIEWFDSQQKEFSGKNICRTIHLPHSHMSRFNDDGSIRAYWVTTSFDIYGFRPGEDCPPYKYQYYISRLDADMVADDGVWKFKKLTWYELESMIPSDYDPKLEPGVFTLGLPLHQPDGHSDATNAADWISIRNLQSRWTLNNRRDAAGDFCHSSDAVLGLPHLFYEGEKRGWDEISLALAELDAREKANADLYLSVPATYAPVIEIAPDGKTARGWWLSMMFDILGPESGLQGPVYPVAWRICRFNQTFIKENGVWKYLEFRLEHLLTLPYRSVDTNKSTGLINFKNKWNEYPLDFCPNPSPQDSFEIEDAIAAWVTYIQNGCAAEWFEQYLAVDSPNLSHWLLVHEKPYDRYNIKYGLSGFAIFAKLMDTNAWKQVKTHGVHTVSTPLVEVAPDGKNAIATCTEFGFSMLNTLEGGPKQYPPYRAQPAVAVYEHRFEKSTDGRWRLSQFKFIVLYQYSEFFFDPFTTRGWAGTCSKRCWPKPFAEYYYTNDPSDPVDELSGNAGNLTFFANHGVDISKI
ncbi:MAG: nuclear transport factor 2 family protein [Dehalococcoidales bacterium]|nr:nuclear transport factor 2 family protein [Dehalococcoidales bacterium]